MTNHHRGEDKYKVGDYVYIEQSQAWFWKKFFYYLLTDWPNAAWKWEYGIWDSPNFLDYRKSSKLVRVSNLTYFFKLLKNKKLICYYYKTSKNLQKHDPLVIRRIDEITKTAQASFKNIDILKTKKCDFKSKFF